VRREARSGGPGRAGTSLWALLTPLGLFAIALAVRALPYPTVFTPDRIVFFGMDAYYHMRRVLHTLHQLQEHHRLPFALSFDPYINFPQGAKPIWPPLFDSAVALVAWPFYAAGGEPAAEAVSMWIPPVLGAATVAALYFTARRFFGHATATLAGLVLCFLSGHYWYSQLGFVDHHAAVALVSTLLLASAMCLLAALSQPEEPHAHRTPALATGVSLALALLLWPGSLLHVGLVEAALVVFLLSRSKHRDAVRGAASFALLHGLALAIILPFSATASWPQWGDYSPTVLSRFQPWLFGVLTLHATGCWFLWRRSGSVSRAKRMTQAAGLAVLLLLASVVLLPDLLEGATDAWQWLAKRESFQASVAESSPLFRLNGAFSGRIAEGRLSYFIYLLPFALGAMAIGARSRSDRPALWFLVAWTLGLLAVTLVQRRFFNSLSVALALSLAVSVAWIAEHLAARVRSRRLRAAVFVTVALGLLAIAMTPVWQSYQLPAENLARARQGRPPLPRRAGPDLLGLLETAEWMRHNTPVTSGYFGVFGVFGNLETQGSEGAPNPPEYGILAHSGHGHVIEYAARRPTLSDNFGDDIGIENFEQVQRYFSGSTEAESLRIADELRARYVLLTKSNPAIPANARAMARRLALDDGSGLSRHRLVFESSTLGRGASARAHKVFEIVPGAEVVGRAAAGARVDVRLELRTNRNRKVVYRASSRASPAGRYALRLPYATDRSEPAGASCCTAATSAYRLKVGGQSARVEISEAQVQSGDPIPGPDFDSR